MCNALTTHFTKLTSLPATAPPNSGPASVSSVASALAFASEQPMQSILSSCFALAESRLLEEAWGVGVVLERVGFFWVGEGDAGVLGDQRRMQLAMMNASMGSLLPPAPGDYPGAAAAAE